MSEPDHTSSMETMQAVLVVDTDQESNRNVHFMAPDKESQESHLPVIDSHCHWDRMLQWKVFGCLGSSVQDVEAAIFAQESTVTPKLQTNMLAMISVFCDPESWHQVGTITEDERIFFTIGIHPQHLAKSIPTEGQESEMRSKLRMNKCVGFGEIGLDFHHAKTQLERQSQIDALRHLLRMYKGTSTGDQKPLVLHMRNSDSTCMSQPNVYQIGLEILREEECLDEKVHLHCFSGSSSDAAVWLKNMRNLYFGFTAKVLHKATVDEMALIVKLIPVNQLVAESDAPYLKPPNMRGPNHPWNVHQVVSFFAEVKQCRMEEMFQKVVTNTKVLYGL